MNEKIFSILIMMVCAVILVNAQLKKDPFIPPEKVILGMVKASTENDARTYLSCFGGELKNLLQEQRNNLGEELFRQRFMTNYQNLMGVVLSNEEKISENLTRVMVEFVFQDTNQFKSYLFERRGNDWKIKKIIDMSNG
ncbi:MAG: hypothetical protein ACMUIA_05710 [bacterium]